MSSRVTTTSPAAELGGSSFRSTPLRHLRVLMVQFAQGLFAAAPAGAYCWTPELDSSEIIVSDENPINLEVVGKRPAISFTRGPIQFYSFCLDDMSHYNFQTGAKEKVILIPGTMSINCCSRVDLECDQIAFILADHIWLLRGELMKQGFFHIGQQISIGAPSPAGSIVSGAGEDEWYCTTVTVPFHFPRRGKITPLGRRIVRSIQTSLQLAEPRTFVEGGPTATSNSGAYGHEIPVGITTSMPEPFSVASDDRGTPDPAHVAPLVKPHIVPHPLNPAKQVILKVSRQHTPGLQPPSMRGRTIPIAPSGVEESEST